MRYSNTGNKPADRVIYGTCPNWLRIPAACHNNSPAFMFSVPRFMFSPALSLSRLPPSLYRCASVGCPPAHSPAHSGALRSPPLLCLRGPVPRPSALLLVARITSLCRSAAFANRCRTPCAGALDWLRRLCSVALLRATSLALSATPAALRPRALLAPLTRGPLRLRRRGCAPLMRLRFAPPLGSY